MLFRSHRVLQSHLPLVFPVEGCALVVGEAHVEIRERAAAEPHGEEHKILKPEACLLHPDPQGLHLVAAPGGAGVGVQADDPGKVPGVLPGEDAGADMGLMLDQ